MTLFIGGNQMQLLRNGVEFFPALEAAIANAEQEIYIQTYIFEADAIGTRIGNALKKAAQRGVMVNVLLDGFGSQDLPKPFVKSLEAAGVRVMFYRPKISPWTFKKNRLRRLHRKVTVIDANVGFVGGINIIDDYNIPHLIHNGPPRLDYAVRIEGALLPAMHASVDKLWRRMAWTHAQPMQPSQSTLITAEPHIAPHLANAHAADHHWLNPMQNIKAAFVLRDNVLHRRDIELAYLKAIAHAKSEIIIANAYFIPGRKFRQALIKAAQGGVTVKLLLQGRMEYILMFATHAFYGVFLRNGIEIYEFHQSFMHCKVAVIDQQWATIGSSNIDPFSLLLAREANVFVKNATLAGELRADILRSIESGAHRIDQNTWIKGNLIKRSVSWVSFGIVRLLLGIIGFSKDKF